MKPRRLVSLAMSALLLVALLLLGAAPASARSSIILHASKPAGDPGLIDVAVSDVSYTAATGSITFTGTVTCYGNDTSLVVVDFSATQTRGGTIRSAIGFDSTAACNEPFTETLVSSSSAFQPGPAVVDVTATACVIHCAIEELELEVVLLP